MLNLYGFSQKNSFNFSTGIGFGINKLSGKGNIPNYTTQKYTVGNGATLNMGYTYSIDSSHALIGIEYQKIFGKTTITHQYNKGNEYATIGIRNIANQFILKTGYGWQIKKIHFEMNAGVILPIKNNYLQTINQKDSVGYTLIQSEYKHYFSVGFHSQLLVSIPIQKNIAFFSALNLNLLNTKVKYSRITQFSNYKYETLETMYPNTADRETNYLKNIEDIRNNETVLPKLFNKNSATDELSYKESFSNWGLSWGFKFLF